MTLPRTLIAVLLLLHNADAVEKPHPMLLHSAYTPFSDTDGSLDVSGVPRLAAQAKKMGVNTIFVGGSMGEFDTMSISMQLGSTPISLHSVRVDRALPAPPSSSDVRPAIFTCPLPIENSLRLNPAKLLAHSKWLCAAF